MLISTGSAASTLVVATPLKPIAPTSNRIMTPPDPPSIEPTGYFRFETGPLYFTLQSTLCRRAAGELTRHDHEKPLPTHCVDSAGFSAGACRASQNCRV